MRARGTTAVGSVVRGKTAAMREGNRATVTSCEDQRATADPARTSFAYRFLPKLSSLAMPFPRNRYTHYYPPLNALGSFVIKRQSEGCRRRRRCRRWPLVHRISHEYADIALSTVCVKEREAVREGRRKKK